MRISGVVTNWFLKSNINPIRMHATTKSKILFHGEIVCHDYFMCLLVFWKVLGVNIANVNSKQHFNGSERPPKRRLNLLMLLFSLSV